MVVSEREVMEVEVFQTDLFTRHPGNMFQSVDELIGKIITITRVICPSDNDGYQAGRSHR